MRRICITSLVILLTLNITPVTPMGSGSDHLLIVQVYYDTYLSFEPETFIAIHNPTLSSIDITGYQITDQEQTITFPSSTTIGSNQTLFITKNATAFYEEFARVADYETEDTNGTVPEVLGTFPTLANHGDEVILKDEMGSIIDVIIYGDSNYSGPGWTGKAHIDVPEGVILLRARDEATGVYLDTDSTADWSYGKYDTGYASHYRKLVAGQAIWNHTELFHTGNITLFVSPDNSFREITNAIDLASSSIYVTTYTLESYQIAEHLVNASNRGVDVRIWMDGDSENFSGVSTQTLYLARMIENAGGKVYFSTQNASADIHDRYDAVHSKTAIIDGEDVWVMSENLGPTGIPADNTYGNRGWGIIIWNNTGLAQYLTQVFMEDTRTLFKDVTRYGTDPEYTAPISGGPDQTIPTGSYWPRFASERISVSSCRIEPILSPDTSRMRTKSVIGMLNSATMSVYVNFFYLYKHWGVPKADYTPSTAPNEYLEAVIEAARRGVQVRILLDDTWYNVEPGDPVDNDDTLAYVNSIAQAEGLDMEARLASSSSLGILKTHNKGIVVDHHKTLVGSINGNYASTTNNREVALIIDDPQVASYFEDVFWNDWNNSIPPNFPAPPTDLMAELSGPNNEHVNITWSLSIDDPAVGQGSNDVVSYAIYHNSSLYNATGENYEFLASVPAGQSYFVHAFAGDGDPKNHFYYVQANSSMGYAGRNLTQVAKFSRLLMGGPNLVSIPLILRNKTIQDIFKTVPYDSIWSYSAEKELWASYTSFKGYTEIEKVNRMMGLWVNVVTSDYWTVAGRVPAVTSIPLYPSWNLIGYPGLMGNSIANVLKNVSCGIVEGFDEFNFPYLVRIENETEPMEAGWGYWLYCSSSGLLTIENL